MDKNSGLIMLAMRLNLRGKIKNTSVPQSKPLLPLFEAVINSFQAFDGATTTPAQNREIQIEVERDPNLKEMENEGRINSFRITDNGCGFGPTQLDSFFESDTEYKASRGGRGVGRFAWLKTFDHAEVQSTYFLDGKLFEVSFEFNINDDLEPSPTPSKKGSVSTTVSLVGMKEPYKSNCPRTLQGISKRLIEHCLPFFLANECPRITLKDAFDSVDVNEYFHQTFAPKITNHSFQIGNYAFTMRGLRIYDPQEKHRLMYAADAREVKTEHLERYVANLRTRLEDEVHQRFVYLGFVEGKYLDENLNQERTAFAFPADDDEEEQLAGITLPQIRRKSLDLILADLKPFLDELDGLKRDQTLRYICNEAPQYRALLGVLDEVLAEIPPNASPRALDGVLHQKMFEKQRELRTQSEKLIDENTVRSLKPTEYEAQLSEFITKANEFGKSSLAEYIAHRKVILDFLERSLQRDSETGKYELEEIVHKIIYPMRAESDEVPYDQQNLWIIDERLAYHTFLASDVRLDHMSGLANSSDSRPDLLVMNHDIFESALAFSEDEQVGSLVVVEFKKPDRTEYSKEDPVDQIYRLVREIRTGQFKRPNGRPIEVATKEIPAYAYAICDITKPLVQRFENKGMKLTPDGAGYYVFNDPLRTYVEVISYNKLLRDAKKRNKVLFEKLFATAAVAAQSASGS